MSRYDLTAAQEHYEQGSFEGLDGITSRYNQTVTDTLTTGEVIAPPTLEPEIPKAKAKKLRTRKAKAETDNSCDDDDGHDSDNKNGDNDDDDAGRNKSPQPRPRRAKRAIECRDTSGDEYMPKKSKSRRKPI